ncbi:uncharacterized protein [Temnothorax longispinosus]|uniref:uncharacterized protein isoform X2 n=1 Tax=Temnothorax longispinosus TaxID=300112 RepID=UPI003A999260
MRDNRDARKSEMQKKRYTLRIHSSKVDVSTVLGSWSNAVPTLFHVSNSPRRIDSLPRKSPYKKLRSEVAGTCAQKVAEVPITPEMNMDYAAPSNHDVSNEVEVSSYMPKSLLSSDSEQTAQVVAGSSLEKKNGHLRPMMLQSAQVVVGSSLEEENQVLRLYN